MNRRGFLGAIAAALVADPERLLWVPGKKKIFIPPPPKTYWQSGVNHRVEFVTIPHLFKPGDKILINGAPYTVTKTDERVCCVSFGVWKDEAMRATVDAVPAGVSVEQEWALAAPKVVHQAWLKS